MLRLVPISLREANRFVAGYHRHHPPARGAKFVIGAVKDSELVGCVIVGRPVAANIDHRRVAEVTRLTTNGAPNCCSFLYAAAARAARAMGYEQIQTYILDDETGVSLRAAGWELDATSKGGTWNRDGRERIDKHPITPKQRWRKSLNRPLGPLSLPIPESNPREQGVLL